MENKIDEMRKRMIKEKKILTEEISQISIPRSNKRKIRKHRKTHMLVSNEWTNFNRIFIRLARKILKY